MRKRHLLGETSDDLSLFHNIKQLHKSTIVYQELMTLYAIQKQSYLAMMPSEICLTIGPEQVKNSINLQVIKLEN